jgi:hypothetical protein
MSQLDRQHARTDALRKRQDLTDEIERCDASAKQKAFMRQHLEQLWRAADLAMGGEETRP